MRLRSRAFAAFTAFTATAVALGLVGPAVLADSHTSIDEHYAALGGADGPLGSPTTEVAAVPGGQARVYERGQILTSSSTPPRAVWGAISVRYDQLGRTTSVLGFPVTDELPTPGTPGRYNHFSGGSIYWTSATGAHEVYGAIRGRWSELGWERSVLGFPTTGELATPTRPGRFNHFEGGSVYWSAATGAHEVYGAIRHTWAVQGWERGALGFPTSGEYAVSTGRRSDFQGGSLTWERSTGRVTLEPSGRAATAEWGTRPAPGTAGRDLTTLDTDQRVVALTIDLGSNDSGVESMLRTLSAHDVKATFYPTGEWVERFPHRMVQIAHAGHVIGNHSFSHPDFTSLTNEEIASELSRTDAAISSRIGRTSKPLFRFPYGASTQLDIDVVNRHGYVAVRWTTDTLGWMGTTGDRPQSVRSVVDRTLADTRPGQIVLMHGGASPDGRVLDAEALPEILDGYRARGYSFVTLASLTS